MTDDGSRQIESYLSIGSYIFNTRAFEFLNRQSIFFSFLGVGGPVVHKPMQPTRESFLSIFFRGGWARRSQAQPVVDRVDKLSRVIMSH